MFIKQSQICAENSFELINLDVCFFSKRLSYKEITVDKCVDLKTKFADVFVCLF
jgi:hypothetical protein